MNTNNKNALRFIDIRGLSVALAGVVLAGTAGTAYAQTITRQLGLGSSGADVTELQTFLASDPTLYPSGLVTGYFGSLTAAAVSKFQTRNGLSAVGRVGPLTLPVLNAQIGTGGVSGGTGGAPAITGLSVNASAGTSATVSWTTNESSKGVVYYSITPLVTSENTNSVNVSGSTALTDTNYHTTQSVVLPGLQANTAYYYLVYTTDQAGNVSVSWPSTFQTAATSSGTVATTTATTTVTM